MTLPSSPASAANVGAGASTFTFTVYGTPAPQGSKRYVGNGRMVESSAKVKPWREAVKWAAIEARGRQPALAGPVVVSLHFVLPKPASAPKNRRTWPAKRPDLDKLIRSSFDAIGDSGMWLDDAQVIRVLARKSYPSEDGAPLDTPGAYVFVGGAA